MLRQSARVVDNGDASLVASQEPDHGVHVRRVVVGHDVDWNFFGRRTRVSRRDAVIRDESAYWLPGEARVESAAVGCEDFLGRPEFTIEKEGRCEMGRGRCRVPSIRGRRSRRQRENRFAFLVSYALTPFAAARGRGYPMH